MIAALVLVWITTTTIAQTPPETIAEVRVHGNATLSDEAVIALAGVAVGSALDAGGTDAVEKRLRQSGG